MKSFATASLVSMLMVGTALVAPASRLAAQSPQSSQPTQSSQPAQSARSAQSGDSDATSRLVEALQIHEGSIVGEMGAGKGERTIAIAKHVGPAGRVYTTELGDSNLDTLRKAIEGAGAKNVMVLAAHATQTNLPEQCCDAIFMENVYHHFEDPAAMNASLLRTLKPGGMVAVVDFAPRGDESTRPADRDGDNNHGVKAATVQAELEKAGFQTVKTDTLKDRAFMVVARKPAGS